MNDSTPEVPAADENAALQPTEVVTTESATFDEATTEAAPTEPTESGPLADATDPLASATDALASATDALAPATEEPVEQAETSAESVDQAESGEPVESPDTESPDTEEPAESDEERMRRLEEEGDIAADYLEELLDITDLDGDIDIDVDGDRASVEIAGANKLARLNRPKGELLDALQELTRLAVQTRTGNRSRLMLDIGGFRAEHKESLEELAAAAIADAKESGEAVPMRPMNPFERKVVHDVAKREGLRSESDGDGKNRHVVIYPAS